MAVVLGVEDWFGLWELLWTVDRYYLAEPRAKRLQASAEAVSRLLDKGLLVMCRVVGTGGPEPDQAPIPQSEVQQAVSDSTSWDPGVPTDHSYWIAATTPGRRALEDGQFHDEGF